MLKMTLMAAAFAVAAISAPLAANAVTYDFNAPGNQLPGDLRKSRVRWLAQGHLARLQKSNNAATRAHRNGGIAKTGETGHRGRIPRFTLDQLLLDLKTGRAGAARLGHERAKWIFVLLATQRLLPNFMGAQRKRQLRGLIEGVLVIAEDLRFREALDDVRRFQHGNDLF